MTVSIRFLALAVSLSGPLQIRAQSAYPVDSSRPFDRRPEASPYVAPDLTALSRDSGDDLGEGIDRFLADRGSLRRFYDVNNSLTTDRMLRQFYSAWRAALERLDFDRLGIQARIDYILFRTAIDHEIRQLDEDRARNQETAPLVPFAETIVSLKEARQRVDPLDPAKAAATLIQLNKQIDELSRKFGAGSKPEAPAISRTVASRAARTVDSLREGLRQWFQFYNGYDPAFAWWVGEPFKQIDGNMQKYAGMIREKLAGVRNRDTIVGDPIGREALLGDLAREMIPYTPEQLIQIANREFAWCDREMLKASRELGFGEDWRRALEHVKNLYVPPGRQPALILEQALEAIDFIQKHDLVTVPPLARDTWRMQMMTPERQRVNPFFTGGEVISVSYPTDGMSHEQKLMSMRGNNIHFSRATVFHELIPGHYLQRFMNERHRSYRRLFSTPFWGEGWSLWWEMLLWDKAFQKSPENRIGALFWRMHRSARIVFSLSFHLGTMNAQECVDYLVDRVGHERENAAAEVRRSFETSYAPLYQSAYLLGGLQFRALHRELVGSRKMTDREFHDAILQLNSIPVELVRASLTRQRLSRNFTPAWKFYGDVAGQ